ncbi:MAG: hypothetical protein RLZZ238_479 [Planctomycetota bacterium]
MVRERWMHLLLLGFALSIVFHVAWVLYLWTVKVEDPGNGDMPASVEIALQELPPQVEVVNDQIELPDPSPTPIGPVTTELDPEPMSALSSEDMQADPGMIEAPGVGAVAGGGGSGSGIGIGSGRGGGGTSFFGVGGRGTRFAFIVDISGSMTNTEDRLTPAMSELKRSINALQDFTQFYVVLYSNDAVRPDFELEGWLKASRANKSRMGQWLDQQGSRGGTYPASSFEIVLSLPQPPDVIFFLTDGEIPGDTLYHIRRFTENLKRGVIINTIGFSSDAGREPLEEIAREYRGVFRFVPTRGARGQP